MSCRFLLTIPAGIGIRGKTCIKARSWREEGNARAPVFCSWVSGGTRRLLYFLMERPGELEKVTSSHRRDETPQAGLAYLQPTGPTAVKG